MPSLSATLRSNKGKGAARSLRRAGQIPAVIYGHNRETAALSVSTRDLEKLLSQISADNTIVELAVDGKTARALIREIQRHPFKRQILHVDFQEVVAGQKITVPVPITVVGSAVGVRMHSGMVEHVLREITMLIDPANIPNHIEVDISDLDIGQAVHVKDLALPEGAEITDDESAPVVMVIAPRAAKESQDEEGEEGESAEPEVIKAKKAEEAEDK